MGSLYKIIEELRTADYVYFRNSAMGPVYRAKISEFNNRDKLGMPKHYEWESAHMAWTMRKIKLQLQGKLK
jgi:hypothetical protein